jgi:hypothetical protein
VITPPNRQNNQAGKYAPTTLIPGGRLQADRRERGNSKLRGLSGFIHYSSWADPDIHLSHRENGTIHVINNYHDYIIIIYGVA